MRRWNLPGLATFSIPCEHYKITQQGLKIIHVFRLRGNTIRVADCVDDWWTYGLSSFFDLCKHVALESPSISTISCVV
jgi:hypothetical protein